jgi:hypothetical protein
LGFVVFLVLLGVAGVLLWRGSALGITLSLVVQALQVPHIATNGLSYHLQAPAGVLVSFATNWDVGFTIDLSVALEFRIAHPVDFSRIAINLLALGCVYALARRRMTLRSVPTVGGVVIR